MQRDRKRNRDRDRDWDLEIIEAAGRAMDAERALQKATKYDKEQLPEPPSLSEEPDDGLSPKQRLAIGHLAAGQSISATAAALDICRSTIHTWKKEPAFARAVQRKGAEAIDAVAARSRNILMACARHLERTARSEMTFDQALRLMNCRRIWDIALLTPKEESAEVDEPRLTGDAGAARSDPT